MSEACAYDVDGTIREGTLLADAIAHGISEGFLDAGLYANPAHPTMEEVDIFLGEITGLRRSLFGELSDRLSDEAAAQTMPWAKERLQAQHLQGSHRILVSLSPDFLVKAYARGLGVHHAFGSYFHTKQLTFSGHAVTRDKPAAIARYNRRHGLGDLDFAAGDTLSDVPMLEAARSAAVVNPADELGKLAVAKGWEIISTVEASRTS